MDSNKVEVEATKKFIEEHFDQEVKPALCEYIKIDNLSREYDKDWETNGKLEKAAHLMIDWSHKQGVKGFKVELVEEKGRTPMILAEIEGTTKDAQTILYYGHLDKQPHMLPWREGLGPTIPVEKDGKLYGRGGADDGYAWFAAILIVQALQAQKVPHPRIVVTIEADEESGSGDIPYYLELPKFKDRIGEPVLCICTDSGCGNYEQLWITNTLRGCLAGVLKVRIATEGVHSGDASGVIPETFRIVRQLLDRVDNADTGVVNKAFHVNIPGDRYKQAEDFAKLAGKETQAKFPWVKGAKPVDEDPFVCWLNRIWRPQLSIVGIDGLPATAVAGNVLRPETNVKLSLRLPPTLNAQQAAKDLKRILEENPPYGAEITFEPSIIADGWNAPENQVYLEESLDEASKNYYGKPAGHLGEGGSIPLLNFFSKIYPKSQFIVTGVLGPLSNAHCPNEFLELNYCKKLIMCLTQVVAEVSKHHHKQ